MSVNKTRRTLGAALIAAPFTGLARAQDFPGKPIRVVVAFAPGGTAEIGRRVEEETAVLAKVIKDANIASE